MDKETVERVAATLRAHYSVPGVWTYAFPVYEPDFHADGWTIADEEGPDNWVYEAAQIIQSAGLVDVYVEAVNHWCITVLDKKDV
jgi:hypothetical protein